MATTDISMDSLEEAVLAINKMLLTKRRFLAEELLREIIVLNDIYSQETMFKKVLEKRDEKEIGKDRDFTIETLGCAQLINFTPKAINDLLIVL